MKIYKIKLSLSTQYFGYGVNEHNISRKFEFGDIISEIKEVTWRVYEGGRVSNLSGFSMYKGFDKESIDLLNKNKIDNFNKYEFKIKDASHKDLPKYFYLEIVGKKLKKYKQMPTQGHLYNLDTSLTQLITQYINLDEWDGKDLFTVEGTLDTILCTEKVKTLIEKNKLKGFRFIELKRVGSDEI